MKYGNAILVEIWGKGNLEQIYHVFALIKNNPKLTLYFDPRDLIIDPSWLQGDSVEIFKGKYQDAEEQLPPSKMCPETRSEPVSTTVYVDASHAANKVTCSGHTGFIIFLNRAPIIWYINIQNNL